MAKCGLCGVDVTFDLMQYYVPDFDGKKHRVCKNCSVKAQDKALKYDPASGRIIVVEKSDIEVRKKCNVCGNVFCYNPVDLDNNKKKQSQAVLSAIGSLGGAMSGHYAASAVHQSNANQAMGGIVDFNKCPQCGSMDLRVISKEELAAEMNRSSAQSFGAPQVSAADELKKFKELLDMGVITQDEFDEKKNALLHGIAHAPQSAAPAAPQSEPAAPVFQQPASAQTQQNTQSASRNLSNLPTILYWVSLIYLLIRGFRDVYFSTMAFSNTYRGALAFLVGRVDYVSAILAGIIWVLLAVFVAIAVKKITTSILNKRDAQR